MKLEEAIKILSSYEKKIVYEITDKDKKAVKTILKYIKEESIPRAVVEEKIKELIKNEKFITTDFIRIDILQELLKKGE